MDPVATPVISPAIVPMNDNTYPTIAAPMTPVINSSVDILSPTFFIPMAPASAMQSIITKL